MPLRPTCRSAGLFCLVSLMTPAAAVAQPGASPAVLVELAPPNRARLAASLRVELEARSLTLEFVEAAPAEPSGEGTLATIHVAPEHGAEGARLVARGAGGRTAEIPLPDPVDSIAPRVFALLAAAALDDLGLDARRARAERPADDASTDDVSADDDGEDASAPDDVAPWYQRAREAERPDDPPTPEDAHGAFRGTLGIGLTLGLLSPATWASRYRGDPLNFALPLDIGFGSSGRRIEFAVHLRVSLLPMIFTIAGDAENIVGSDPHIASLSIGIDYVVLDDAAERLSAGVDLGGGFVGEGIGLLANVHGQYTTYMSENVGFGTKLAMELALPVIEEQSTVLPHVTLIGFVETRL